jgi:hypothetical protein
MEVGALGESHAPSSNPLAATAPPDNKIKNSRRRDSRCVSSSLSSNLAPGGVIGFSAMALLHE